MSILKQTLSTKERRGILLLIGILCCITIYFSITTNISNNNYLINSDDSIIVSQKFDTVFISNSKKKSNKNKIKEGVESPLSRPMTKHSKQNEK